MTEIEAGPATPRCSCRRTADETVEVIPFGADLHLRTLRKRGMPFWWIRAAVCDACGQHGLIAQEELVNDVYLLRKIGGAEADATASIDAARWPVAFDRYDTLLAICASAGRSWRDWDRSATGAIATAHVLRRERPAITIGEIVTVLGLSPHEAGQVERDFASVDPPSSA